MAKRTAEYQLTQENFESEEEEDRDNVKCSLNFLLCMCIVRFCTKLYRYIDGPIAPKFTSQHGPKLRIFIVHS